MSVLILGTFDGVHTAHRQLIRVGKQSGESIIACTFSSPFSKQKQLTTADEKVELLKECGVSEVFMQDFDCIKDLSPEEYVSTLVEKFHPTQIITGFNHTFGKDAAGSPKTLSRLSRQSGYTAVAVPPVINNGVPVSSTLIRSLLSSGRIEEANALLERRYCLSGITVRGRQLGSSISFPTANTQVDENKLLPQDGVYATLVDLNGRRFKGMTNIGTNPTVSDKNKTTVETHILGFHGDLYEKTLKISFVKRIRADKKFSSIDELKKQLSDDALLINAYLDTVDIR